jgi:hypothetical protein
MINIEHEDLFGKVIADAVTRVNSNLGINSFEKVRAVNAIAKAAYRIQTSGAFMEFSADDGNLLIWSDSNEIYEIKPDGRCQCKAHMNGNICWHRAAKRLLEHYFTAEKEAADIEYMQSEGWSREGSRQVLGLA